MDLHALLTAYNALPEPARQACTKVAGAVLTKLAGDAWRKLAGGKDPAGAAFARVYEKWREGLLDSEVEDKRVAAAFGEFFCRLPTLQELDKLRHDHYQEIDFDVLTQQLRESCHWAGCPLPENDLHEQLNLWIEGLEALLQELPEYQQSFRPSIRDAIANLNRPEGAIRSFSLARRAYLKECLQQHRLIRFRGFAEVAGPPEVEMAKVFVMPRVAAQRELDPRRKKEPEPAPARASSFSANRGRARQPCSNTWPWRF